MVLEDRLKEVRLGLAQLRKLGIHGNARYHRYELNPVASEKEIEQFERTYQIILPEDYRAFLLLCGNGGAGPDQGLERLGEWPPWGHLDNIFPFKQVWSPYGEEWPPVDVPMGRSFDEEPYPEWLWDGALQIGGAGCDFKNLLVVTGTERGNMWLSEMDNEIGFVPYGGLEDVPQSKSMFPFYKLGGEGRISFLDWYEHWLFMALRGTEANAAVG